MRKNYFHYLFLFFVVLLAGCNKDDGPKPDVVIGTWKIDTETYTNLKEGFKVYEKTYDGAYVYNKYEILFKADKTYSSEIRSGQVYVDQGSWTKNGSTYTLKSDKHTETDEFVLDGDKLVNTFTATVRLRHPDFPDDETKEEEMEITVIDTFIKK